MSAWQQVARQRQIGLPRQLLREARKLHHEEVLAFEEEVHHRLAIDVVAAASGASG